MIGWLLTGGMMLVAALVALQDWRRGLLFCFWVGIIQDPLRKIVPGQSVAMQLLVLVAFGFVTFAMFRSGRRLRISDLYRGSRGFQGAMRLLIVIVVLQCLHTLFRYGNPILAGLGLMTYFAPMLAALVGWAYVRKESDVERLMRFYLVLAVPACLTVFISYLYPDQWDLFREIGDFVGEKLLIYDFGSVLASNSGVFRVGEVAAWHAAISCIFLFIIAARSNSTITKIVAGLLIVALIAVIILTGRRKMLAALAVFLGCYVAFLLAFWQNRGRLGLSSILIAFAVGSVIWLQFPDLAGSPYLQRGVSVFADGGKRVGTSRALLTSAVWRGGFFGKGAGVSAQGAQYFGGGVDIVGGSSEAGLGKIYVELGVPGSAAIVYLLFQAGLWIALLYKRIAPNIPQGASLFCGLLAAIVANGVTFMVATQIFGDMFVQLFLGVMLGMSLSLNKLLIRIPTSTQMVKRNVMYASRG